MEGKRSRQKTGGGAEEMDSDELAELLNEADKQEDFDAVAVRKLVLDFERAASVNQTNRALHPQDPSKWLDSEVALDEAIKALHVLGSTPSLYPVVVELKVHESLVGLLAHENVDVGGSVLGLIAELLEGTDNEEEAIYVRALAGEFAEAGLLTSLVANWDRLRQLGEGATWQAFFDRLALTRARHRDWPGCGCHLAGVEPDD